MLTENLDKEAKESFDKQLEADPTVKPTHPYSSGPNRNVHALMVAARMPQSNPLSFGGGDN